MKPPSHSLSPSKEYPYVGTPLVVTIGGAVPKYHHADHLSVRVTTDAAGSKLGEQGHYPFGESWYSVSTTTKWHSAKGPPRCGHVFSIA